MATVKELIEMAMKEAVWCEQCEEDFTEMNGKVAPDETEVYFTRQARVVCENCAERAFDDWSERQIS